jgi:ubiquinone/menaquinone biosynthesis C-methylase UbiE
LKEIAKRLGDNGKAYGIDIYSGMLEVSRKKLVKAGLMNRVELYCGDATEMPYDDAKFDAVFSSFTLELFDTPEIPKVLSEITRVLRPKGRFGLVSMSKEEGNSFITRLYEWFHTKFPEYIDCRPIYIEQSLKDAGLEIKHKEKMKMFGLPIEIVIAEK